EKRDDAAERAAEGDEAFFVGFDVGMQNGNGGESDGQDEGRRGICANHQSVSPRLKISANASSTLLKRKEKPRSEARTGRARCPLSSSASAISPSISLSANPGAGSTLGRLRAWPSAFENSTLRTGFGAVAFSGPRAASCCSIHA